MHQQRPDIVTETPAVAPVQQSGMANQRGNSFAQVQLSRGPPYGDNQWAAEQLTMEKRDNVAITPILADIGGPLANTQDIPQYHVIMEQLAHRFAYDDSNLNPEQMAKMDSGLAGIGYRRVRVVESGDTGFQAVLFEPILESAPVETGYKAELGWDGVSEPAIEQLHTVVAFRGTDMKNSKDFRDDVNGAGVGAFQFSMHEGEIRDLLAQASSLGHGPPDVTGHSLGGALAQRAAASYGSMIRDIITFQSPGLNAEDASSVDPEQHTSTHYRLAGDVVPTAGENVTSGEIVRFSQEGVDNPGAHSNFPLAQLNARRHDQGDNFVPGVYDLAEKESYLNGVERQSGNEMDEQMVSPVSEGFRLGLGFLTSQDMTEASRAWRDFRPSLDKWVVEGVPDEEVAARARAYLSETITLSSAQVVNQLVKQAESLYKQLQGDDPWIDWAARRNGDYSPTSWASVVGSMMEDKGRSKELLDALKQMAKFGMLESVFSESEYEPMEVVKMLAASSARLPYEFVQLMAGTTYADQLGEWWSGVESRLQVEETARVFEEESKEHVNTPKLDQSSGLATDFDEQVALQIEEWETLANQTRLLAKTKEIFADHVHMAPSESVEYTNELRQGLDDRDVQGVARTLEQISAQFGKAGLDRLLRENFTYRSFDDVAVGGMSVVAAALLNTSFQR
jgi:pimeloyl-ACP methyl ester carboxylesterase